MGEKTTKKEVLDSFKSTKDVWKTASELDLDPSIVRYHLTAEGIKLPKGSYRQRGAGKHSTAPISQLHSAIGAKLAYLRMDKHLGDIARFSFQIGMSAKKYGAIERGQTEATVSDLARIAHGFSLSISDLLQPLQL